LTRVQLDHVALDAFAASAHESYRGVIEIEQHPTPLLSVVFLSEGRFDVEVSQARFALEPGQFIVVDSRDPIRYTTDSDVRLLMTTVGVEHVPPYLQARGMTIVGPLRRTALTDSFLAFTSAVLRSATVGRPATGAELIQATADLQCAVLAEAQTVTSEPTGPAGVRYRMEEYIEAHLTDPDLRPGTIAEALGISVRHAHNVFNNGERTISRYIRDRRIFQIGTLLRTQPEDVDLPTLATRFGFPSTEEMSRVFRLMTGMSPTEYRAGGHRSLG
jgi:AraC-like DNA-binding protein